MNSWVIGAIAALTIPLRSAERGSRKAYVHDGPNRCDDTRNGGRNMQQPNLSKQPRRTRRLSTTSQKNRDLVIINADNDIHDLLFSYRRIAGSALKLAALRAVQSIAAVDLPPEGGVGREPKPQSN